MSFMDDMFYSSSALSGSLGMSDSNYNSYSGSGKSNNKYNKSDKTSYNNHSNNDKNIGYIDGIKDLNRSSYNNKNNINVRDLNIKHNDIHCINNSKNINNIVNAKNIGNMYEKSKSAIFAAKYIEDIKNEALNNSIHNNASKYIKAMDNAELYDSDYSDHSDNDKCNKYNNKCNKYCDNECNNVYMYDIDLGKMNLVNACHKK